MSGALIEETYPSTRVVKNVLDADGDLELVQSKKNVNQGFFNYARSFSYTAAGAVSSMQLGNGKWESTQFNSRLQPTQIALGTVQNGTDKLKLNYDYGTTNNNGNVLSQTINVPTTGNAAGFTAVQSYVYDSLNRLKSATENINGNQTASWKQTFQYDRYGNRNFDTNNTTTILAGSLPKVVNPEVLASNNRFKPEQDGDGIDDYLYDAAGSVTKDASGRQFTYDGENKQTKVVSGGQTVGEYFYDGDGKRVKKVVGTEITIFVYDALGKLVAEYSNQTAGNQVSYLTQDNLGTPRINTDQNGNVIARHDYLPFGEEIDSSVTAQRNVNLSYGDDGVKKKFAGYEKDIETKLDFAQSRMFSSGFGRFTSPDSFANDTHVADPQSWNLYAYARNNPLLYIDPTGKSLWVRIGDVSYQYVERGGQRQLVDASGVAYAPTAGSVGSATAGFLERMNNQVGYSGRLGNLIDSDGYNEISVGLTDSRPNGGTSQNDILNSAGQTVIGSTDTSVAINGNDDESFVQFVTAVSTASDILGQSPNITRVRDINNNAEQFNNNVAENDGEPTDYQRRVNEIENQVRIDFGISGARASNKVEPRFLYKDDGTPMRNPKYKLGPGIKIINSPSDTTPLPPPPPPLRNN